MKLSYVISAYFGNRHTPSEHLLNDPLYYIKQQMSGINKCKNDISKIYLICTFDNSFNQSQVLDYLVELKQNDNRILLYERDNLGGSYCSWQSALWEDNGESDYVFLVEDDYVLEDPNGINFLMENYFREEPDLFYLCQLWSKKLYNTFGDNIPEHASMSCGIINNKLYDKYRKENGIDFKLWYGTGYETMWRNQSCFLENHRQMGLKFRDWTDKCSSYFPQSDLEYGQKDGIKILKSLI